MRLAASSWLMFREFPFLDRFAAAKTAGFDGLDILVLEAGAHATARAAQDAGMAVSVLCLDLADFLEGGLGLSAIPARRDRFNHALDMGLATADILGVRRLHLGPSRRPPGVARQACVDCLRRNLDDALPRARAAGVRLLLEPINRIDAPDSVIGTIEDVLDLIAWVDDETLGLQFDAYHVAMSGEDPADAFVRARPWVHHVQLADCPGRRAPGRGCTNFEALLHVMTETAYDGWVAAEYRTGGPTAASLGWMSRWRAAGPKHAQPRPG